MEEQLYVSVFEARDRADLGDGKTIFVKEEKNLALPWFEPGGKLKDLPDQSSPFIGAGNGGKVEAGGRGILSGLLEVLFDLVVSDGEYPGFEVFIGLKGVEVLKGVKDGLLVDIVGLDVEIQGLPEKIIKDVFQRIEEFPEDGSRFVGSDVFSHLWKASSSF
jgi:hypothetical protein